MAARFGYLPVASGLLEGDALEGLLAEYVAPLAELGGERWRPGEGGGDIPLVFLVATGGTEREIMKLHARRTSVASEEPLVLVALPTRNSLPAALEVLARTRQHGRRGRICPLDGSGDAAGLERLSRTVSDLGARSSLHNARVGLVGPCSDWLVASAADADAVRAVWGPEVVPIGLRELTAPAEAPSDDAIAKVVAPFVESARGIDEPVPADLDAAAGLLITLRDLVASYRLAAVTVRCFDLLTTLSTTGCLALSRLADEGIVAGCEGDVVSTVAMLWARTLLGETAWMANPSRVDAGANRVWLAHCTVPSGMVAGYRVRSHFESGIGVAIEGEFEPGPVTLLRVGGRRLDLLWIAEGGIVRAGDSPDRCRTQAEIALDSGDTAEELLERPLGNHVVLVRGRHAERLKAWWEFLVAPPD